MFSFAVEYLSKKAIWNGWFDEKGNFFKGFLLVVIGMGASAFVLFFLLPDVSRTKKVNPSRTAFIEHRMKEWA